ncbi:hypothetical protein GDO78_012209 [Eleutherodactylus coqui]|uniref:Cyclin I n=2 Tax=Eleutherodactylus coqui TaxID=57060 RepID=A0A8J6F3X9_ELECQ|nr:hypothetical protein GDO78_012209 [Eleutherodactylus coqui]
MKYSGPLESQRLSFLLERAVSREAQMWKVYVHKTPTNQVLRMERIILDKLNWDLHTATPLDFLYIFHAILLTTSPQLLDSMHEGIPSQHVALLTHQLLQCTASHQLLQFKGSMLALAVLSLDMEKLLPDWLALTIKLLQSAQMDSTQLFLCREEASRHLSPLQASLPPNTVYVYSPLKRTLVTCNRGEYLFRPSPVPGPRVYHKGKSTPGSLMKGATYFYQRLAAPGACKQASAKRKVEQMEVDDFYDGIKRLYNEDSTVEVGSVEIATCNGSLPRQEGSISPCPQLQAVSVM